MIGIPAYNEEKNIGPLILKLNKKYQDILVCNDGSTDLTGEIASSLGAMVTTHERNQGYGAAIKTIFEEAKKNDVDVLITFDGDGQHDIADIESMIDTMRKNQADIVIGSRFLSQNKEIPKYRKIGIKTITGLTNYITNSKITDSQSGFRAYSKNSLNKIFPTETGMGISTEILIKAAKNQIKITEIPISISYENNKHSQEPISHGASVIISTIKHVAIDRPLLYYGVTGLVFLVLGLIFGAWTFQIYADEGIIMTSIGLMGVGGVILGTILLISATILFSIVNLIGKKE